MCHVHLRRGGAPGDGCGNWSSLWSLLSSYAVISYTDNRIYVCFAAIGSWIGAFASITFLHHPPVGAAPE